MYTVDTFNVKFQYELYFQFRTLNFIIVIIIISLLTHWTISHKSKVSSDPSLQSRIPLQVTETSTHWPDPHPYSVTLILIKVNVYEYKKVSINHYFIIFDKIQLWNIPNIYILYGINIITTILRIVTQF